MEAVPPAAVVGLWTASQGTLRAAHALLLRPVINVDLSSIFFTYDHFFDTSRIRFATFVESSGLLYRGAPRRFCRDLVSLRDTIQWSDGNSCFFAFCDVSPLDLSGYAQIICAPILSGFKAVGGAITSLVRSNVPKQRFGLGIFPPHASLVL